MKSLESAFGWFSFTWISICATALLVATVIIDGQGRKPWHHAEPVPERVAMVTPDSYIVQDGGPSPSSICKESDNIDDTGIEDTARIQRLRATFVECSRDQTWGDPRPGSKNFFNAAKEAVTSPYYFAPAGVLALALTPMLISGRRHDLRRAADQRAVVAQRAKERQAEKVRLEDKRAAVGAAYAKDEITEAEMEHALGKLLKAEARL